MKKILMGMLVLAAVTGTSCKKDKDDPACEKSVAGITNNFKLTRFTLQSSAGGGEVDQTLDDCDKSAIYSLKADKSATYLETGSACNSSTDTGNWDVVNGKITIGVGFYPYDNLNIYTWDCSTLVVGSETTVGPYTATTKYYFSKQ